MAGTFTIKVPTSVSANSFPAGAQIGWGGGNFGSNGADRLASTGNSFLLAGISSLSKENPSLYCGWQNGAPPSNPVGSWLVRFGFGHADQVISLDGMPNISFNELPAGIRILTATLSVTTFKPTNGNGDAAGDMFLQQGTLTESADLNQVTGLGNTVKSFAYDFSIPGFGTFLDVINDGFGIRTVFATNGSVNQGYFNAVISGTYDILFYNFDIDPPFGTDVDPGETITITSPGTDPLTDLDLSELTITMACGTVVPIVQTQQLFVFTIPFSCSGAGSSPIVAIGNGTQFSGSVPLGSLTILTANASGIYFLSPGKASDTLYSGARDGSTYDVKIPDPFAKTGFVNG